jgi:hypothetical protein
MNRSLGFTAAIRATSPTSFRPFEQAYTRVAKGELSEQERGEVIRVDNSCVFSCRTLF